MHTFLIIYTQGEDYGFHIVNAWDTKEAIEKFYDKTGPHAGSMTTEMFRKVIKTLTVGEAVAIYNSLTLDKIIASVFENLCEVDLSNEFGKENDHHER